MAVTLNYVPHAGQMAIHQARGYRFRTVCSGRRWGKTRCLAGELLDRGGTECGGNYGWVGPTYAVAERGIEAFRSIADGFVRVVGRMPTRVEFTGAAGPVKVWFLSADNADAIRGHGFQGLVIDEAAVIPADVWHYVLRPTIAQTLGWAVFVSTPVGRNWFYDLYTRGQDPTEKDYASFRFPSNSSPYFPQSEFVDAERTLPSAVYRQEYLAEFLEDSAGVFRNVAACTVALEPLIVGSDRRQVVIGADLAKHSDFTVLIALDAVTGQCLAMDRFNQLDWPIQKERILAFARQWRGRLYLDATGIGDPIYDDLRQVYSDIEPIKFTAPMKTALIQRLIVAIEQQQISWPAAWEILTAELQRYEYQISSTGNISYNAPSGYHDDCVIALALANWGRWQAGNVGMMARLGGSGKRQGGRRGERAVVG